MRLVVLITSQSEAGFQVAEAWHEVGAPGVTIIPSFGLHSIHEQLHRGSVELPMHAMSSMGSALAHIINSMEHTNHTILSVVPAELIPKLVEVTQNELGDLLSPNTGLLFVINLEMTVGVINHGQPNEGNA